MEWKKPQNVFKQKRKISWIKSKPLIFFLSLSWINRIIYLAISSIMNVGKMTHYFHLKKREIYNLFLKENDLNHYDLINLKTIEKLIF